MVIAQGSKPELAIEPNVLSCDAGIFQPQTVTFFADWSLQKIASFCFTAERSEWGDSMEGTVGKYINFLLRRWILSTEARTKVPHHVSGNLKIDPHSFQARFSLLV